MEVNNQSDQDIGGKYTKDDAYQSIRMINSWISNIDTKMSFGLAFVGVLIGVIFNRGTPRAFVTVIKVSKISELSGVNITAIFIDIVGHLIWLKVIKDQPYLKYIKDFYLNVLQL